jgi:hypothetical protein
MFDLVLPAEALLIGGIVAAVVLFLAGWSMSRPWRANSVGGRVVGARVCWSWAIGAGVLAASAATDQGPSWPPLEDRSRFLALIVPLTLLVETLAGTMPSCSGAWIARLCLAAAVAPILLYNTVYLADLNGPNSAEWSSAQTLLVLAGLAALLSLVWALLSGLEARTSTPTVLWLLTLDALASAVTVMLSGYFGGGLLGLGLCGALTGATLATYIVRLQLPTRGSLGMAVIGIFSVLLVGRFLGNLPTGEAVCLLLAPLLAWTVELPRLRRLTPAWRTAGLLACVALPLIIVVLLAQQRFKETYVAGSRPSDAELRKFDAQPPAPN